MVIQPPLATHKDHSFIESPRFTCISLVGPALTSLGLSNDLVANSTTEYVHAAMQILKDPSGYRAYELRVKLFDSLDALPINARCFSSNIADSKICPHVSDKRNAEFVRGLNEKYDLPDEKGLFLSDLER